MVLQRIKNLRSKERGFTIVELLIVIVVIGILAGITIVAYSGITSRANNSKAQSNATSVQSVLEAYQADNGSYPISITALKAYAGSTRLPGSITVLQGPAGNLATNSPTGAFTTAQLTTGWTTTQLSGSNGLTAVAYSVLSSSAPNGGGVIIYWDFVAGTIATNYIYVGNGSAASTFVSPGA